MNLRMSRFIIDGDRISSNGFLEIDVPPWNGWAKPWFTKQQITRYLSMNKWKYCFDYDGSKYTLVIDFEDKKERYEPQGPSELYSLDGLEWMEVK